MMTGKGGVIIGVLSSGAGATSAPPGGCYGCTTTTILIFVLSIFLQLPVKTREHGDPPAWSPRKRDEGGRPRSLAEKAEPSDGDILRAVVQSMQAYYARQASRAVDRLLLLRRDEDGTAAARPIAHHHRVRKRDEEVACYEDLGCFRDEGPFDYLDMLPLPPDRIQTQFLLYTRRNPELPEPLHYANVTSLYTSAFNRSNPTKMMIHGFGSSCQKMWAVDMRKALLQVDDANVICVDWAEGAALPNYVQAAANTRLVGKQVARLVSAINMLRGTNNTRFHLIGFSLGAHVAGFAGDELRNISRITGLDPAAPLFEGYTEKTRLDPSDADFVDVIHSNGDSLLYGGLGAYEPMGHVDYYPNGGKVQAGCSNIFVGAISDLLWYQSRSADGRSLCNHRRAYKFFTDSVLPTCSFLAFECTDYDQFLQGHCFPCDPLKRNCGNMGYHADKSPARGRLYLLTRTSEPFCANQFKVIVESSPGLTPTYGGLELTLIGWNQLNETFQLSSEWEQLVPSEPLTRVIVAHPSLTDLLSAQIKYIPYKGWITNGLEQWAVDRITVVDGFGRKYSFCRRGLPLEEGKPTTVYLRNEDCVDSNAAANLALDVPTKAGDNSNAGARRPVPPSGRNKLNTIASADKMIADGGKPHGFGAAVKKQPTSVENGGDVVVAAAASSAVNYARSNLTKLPNKLQNQVLYFQFFPVPIRSSSKNATKAGLVFRETLKDGMAYNVAEPLPLGRTSSNAKQQQASGLRYGLKSPLTSSSSIVRLIPSGQDGKTAESANRLGRKLSSSGPAVVPDISAQIIFVPNARVAQIQYIPLRPAATAGGTNKGSNSSSRIAAPVVRSRASRIGPSWPYRPAMLPMTSPAATWSAAAAARGPHAVQQPPLPPSTPKS